MVTDFEASFVTATATLHHSELCAPSVALVPLHIHFISSVGTTRAQAGETVSIMRYYLVLPLCYHVLLTMFLLVGAIVLFSLIPSKI